MPSGHITMLTLADGSVTLSWSRQRAIALASGALAFVAIPGIGLTVSGASPFLWVAFGVSSVFLLFIAAVVLRATAGGPLYTLDVSRGTVYQRDKPMADFANVACFELREQPGSRRIFRLSLVFDDQAHVTLFESSDADQLQFIGAACAKAVGVNLIVATT